MFASTGAKITTLYAFTDDEVRKLKEFLATLKGYTRNPAWRPHVEEHQDASMEVYVGVTTGTIPALVSETDTGSGTGSFDYDRPGSGLAALKRVLIGTETTKKEVHPLPGNQTRTVYNYSKSAIPAGTYVLAVKDKFGMYAATPVTSGGGGGGGGSVGDPLQFDFNGSFSNNVGNSGSMVTVTSFTLPNIGLYEVHTNAIGFMTFSGSTNTIMQGRYQCNFGQAVITANIGGGSSNVGGTYGLGFLSNTFPSGGGYSGWLHAYVATQISNASINVQGSLSANNPTVTLVSMYGVETIAVQLK